MSINTLPSALLDWETNGQYITIGPFQHKVFTKQYGDATASPTETLLLIHGFPESSYSYQANVSGLLQHFKRFIRFSRVRDE